eukprot:gene4976-biopygen12902
MRVWDVPGHSRMFLSGLGDPGWRYFGVDPEPHHLQQRNGHERKIDGVTVVFEGSVQLQAT